MIIASEARFNPEYEKLAYKVDGKKKKIRYNQLRSVSSEKFTFRYFSSGKKHHGYFVKTETSDKTLTFLSYTPSSGSTTGFAAIPRVVLAIFDKSGNLIEEYSIPRGISENDIAQRLEIAGKVQKHFSDCPKFISELEAYLKAKPDEKNWRIAQYFQENTKLNPCE